CGLERAGPQRGSFALHRRPRLPRPEYARGRERGGRLSPLPDEVVRELGDALGGQGDLPTGGPGRGRRSLARLVSAPRRSLRGRGGRHGSRADRGRPRQAQRGLLRPGGACAAARRGAGGDGVRALEFVEKGNLEWREAPDAKLEGDGQAVVKPVALATCDI